MHANLTAKPWRAERDVSQRRTYGCRKKMQLHCSWGEADENNGQNRQSVNQHGLDVPLLLSRRRRLILGAPL